MGTHPIFESDIDCLTECCFSELDPQNLAEKTLRHENRDLDLI